MEKNDIQAAINAGITMAHPFEINGVPAVLVPEGASLVLKPELMDYPQRIERSITLDTVESFIAYCNKFITPASIIFADITTAKFTAIFDYHHGDSLQIHPNWCEHLATYTCPPTIEWSRWKAKNETWMSQEDFALFIEKNINDVIEPAGSELLEVALTLEAKNKVSFRSGIRLDNGQHQLTYEENIDGKAGEKGQLRIPQKIKLGLRLFIGGAAYEVEAAFRYRVKDGTLTMRYDILRQHLIHEDAIKSIYKTIENAIRTGCILQGKP